LTTNWSVPGPCKRKNWVREDLPKKKKGNKKVNYFGSSTGSLGSKNPTFGTVVEKQKKGFSEKDVSTRKRGGSPRKQTVTVGTIVGAKR